jgi:hypothetical protein
MMQSLNILHRKVENGLGPIHEEIGRHKERRDNYKRSSHSISVSRTQRYQSYVHSFRIFYAFEESRSIPEVSLVRNQRRIFELDNFQGELKKLKPTSFDGEREKEYDVEYMATIV